MAEDIYLSIVIPAFKEETRIPAILDAIEKYTKNKEFAVETIVVDDASPDDTVGVVHHYDGKIPNLRIITNKRNKGKAGVVRQGVLEARGKYILFADADNSTPVQQVDKLLREVPKYDVVIGSRYCPGGKLAIPQPLVRRVGSRILNIIIQIIAVTGIKDTQCGFKLFERGAARAIFSRQTITGWSFDIEILAIAKKLGYRIEEVGITWYDNPHSRVKPFKDGWKMIQDAWQVRKNILSGKYRLSHKID